MQLPDTLSEELRETLNRRWVSLEAERARIERAAAAIQDEIEAFIKAHPEADEKGLAPEEARAFGELRRRQQALSERLDTYLDERTAFRKEIAAHQ